jgi:transposase
MRRRSQDLAAALVPRAAGLRLDGLHLFDSQIVVTLTSTTLTAACPRCGRVAARIRGRYQRTLADLPWSGFAVRLVLTVRKFACDVANCVQRIFTERLPAVMMRYARRTNRLADVVRVIAFAAGGAAGSRVLDRLQMPTSAATLLRLIRCTTLPPSPAPRVLGIDDWARRKGQTYGTICVDLERRRPVDLLPDRSAAAVSAWLRAHPSIAIISRDRGGAYADGAALGAPTAVQVADRWHLLRNLGEAVERTLQKHAAAITQLFSPATSMPPVALADVKPSPPRVREQLRSQHRRAARLERYTLVHELHAQGLTQRAIAGRLGISKKTVQRFLHATAFPERRTPARRRSRLDPYKPYLLERWHGGCHNGAQLWREIQRRGYAGGRSILRDFLAQLRNHHGPSPAPVPAPTVRELVWQILRRPDTVTEAAQQTVARVRTAHPEIDQAVQLTLEFATMVRTRQSAQLEPWLWRVANSEIAALRSFAAGIQRDKAAVLAGLTLEWSQGQVEGQITRLKLLKRGMYGRAKLDLLRQRMLYEAEQCSQGML